MWLSGSTVHPETCLLRGLLGFLCVLPVWTSFLSCQPLNTLKDSLNISLRRRYMKHYLPINYTVRVRYEEVFRLHNISRLRSGDEVDVATEPELQELWLRVNTGVLKTILGVLPERHPTRHRYLTNLEKLFRKFGQVFEAPKETDLTERIENIFNHLTDPNYPGGRSMTPKALLDNGYRTMHCLFRDCFPMPDGEYDYCDILYWRKAKRTPAPTQQT